MFSFTTFSCRGIVFKNRDKIGAPKTSRLVQASDLVEAERKFGLDFAEHGNAGTDRMDPKHHNYAPIYSDYINRMDDKIHTIVEVGILGGTGLGMWNSIFPDSKIFGFDRDTHTYNNNLENLKKVGFDDSKLLVQQMDQRQVEENKPLFESTFSSVRPDIVVDDGFHAPDAGWKTFASMKPFLADMFIYFIEDIVKSQFDSGKWKDAEGKIRKLCPECDFTLRCPEKSSKPECIAVITRNLSDQAADFSRKLSRDKL